MIAKILSISDVITNSSSEVFVMDEYNATYYKTLADSEYPGVEDCIYVKPIDWDFIRYDFEWDMIMHLIGVPRKEINNNSEWDAFCEEHKEKLNDLVEQNLYFVEIEDHFKDAFEFLEYAHDDCIYSDNRH